MALNSVFKVAIVGTYFGQEIVLTSHYRQTLANTSVESDTDSLAVAVQEDVLPSLIQCCVFDMIFNRIEVRSLVPPGGVLLGTDLALTEDNVGTQDATGMPPSVAIVLRRRTAQLGRKYRGRQYLPATPLDWLQDGGVDPTAAAAQPLTYANTLKAVVQHTGVSGSPTFAPVIAALDGTAITPTPGVRNTLITSVEVDLVYRNQRRRQAGVGE